MTYHMDWHKRNTLGATGGADTVYPSGAPEFTPVYVWFMVLDH